MNRSGDNQLTDGGAEVVWTRDFVLLLVSSLLLWCSFYLPLITLPIYIVRDLGGNSTQVGLLSTVVSLVAMVARPFAGNAMDRLGRRPIHLGTLLLFGIMTLGYGLPGGLAGVFLVRAVNGLPFGGATSAAQTVAADLVPEKRRGEGLGYAGMAATVATAVGPAIALSLLESGTFTRVVLSSAGLAAGALLLALPIRHPLIRDPRARLSLSALLEPRVGRLAVTCALALIGYGGVVSFVTLYAQQLGIAHPGWFFTASALGSLVSRPVGGAVFDRRGPRPVAVACLALMLGSYVTLGLGRGEVAFLAAGCLLGLGQTSLVLAMQTMAVNVVPAERRGASGATVFSAIDLGIGFGSYALGALADGAGSYAVMYQIAAALLLLPAAMFFLWVMPQYDQQMAA
jgi:predicted MFS family arabinose efflux permease